MGSINDLLANYNPTGFVLGNQQRAATIAGTQAQTAQTGAATQGQILANQRAQQQIQDQAALASIFAAAGRQAQNAVSSVPPATPAAGTPPAAPPQYSVSPADPNNPNGLQRRTPIDPGNAGVPAVPRGTPAIATPGFAPGAGGPPAGSVAGANPVTGSTFLDPNSLMQQYYAGGGRGTEPIFNAINQIISSRKAAADLSKEQLSQEEGQRELAASTVQNLLALPPEQRASVFAQQMPRLQREAPDVNWKIDPTDDNALHQVLGQTVLHKALLDQAKTQSETANANANAAKTKAETPGVQAQSEITQQKAAAMKQAVSDFQTNPTGVHPIDRVLPAQLDPDANSAYKENYNVAMRYGGPDAALNVVKEATAHAAEIGMKTSPTVQSADTAQVLANKKATAPIEQALAASSERLRDSLQQGDVAHKEYFDSLSAYQKALSTAKTIGNVVDLSENGGTLAGKQLQAMVPEFTNAAQDIKRMGAAQNNAGMSSAGEGLLAEAKSLATGVPLTAGTIKQIKPYLATIANGAAGQHNATVEALQKTYPQQAGTLQKEPLPFPPPFPKGKVHDYAVAHGISDDAATKAITAAGNRIE